MGIIAPFIPMKIENSTCEIAFAALSTLFLCCVRVVYQNTRALLLLLFCYFTQRDMCLSRTLQHIHNMRREKRKKNNKIDESSKVERMPGILLAPQTKDLSLFQNLSLNICKLSNYCMNAASDTRAWIHQFLNTHGNIY